MSHHSMTHLMDQGMFVHLVSILALDGTPALQKQNNYLSEVAPQLLNNLHDLLFNNLSNIQTLENSLV